MFLVLIFGALLVAGLSLFLGRKSSDSVATLKPSQLDFSKSNKLPEPAQTIAESSPGGEASADAAIRVAANAPADVNLLSEPEKKLWLSFEEILISKNDSDPRVNNLKNLSAEFRKALVEKYNSLKPEDRNGRGFIVFLISKELTSASDLEFLQKVYQEQPCLSLENCSTVARDDNPHTAGIDQTSMNYPQLVALYQIDKQLEAKPEILRDPALRSGILATLKQAEAFPVPSVRERAEKIRQKYQL